MKRCWCAAFLVVAASCGGDDSGGPSSCDPPQGAYLFKLRERSGTCEIGTFEFVSTFDGTIEDFATDDACVATNTVTDNGCALIADSQCPVVDGAGRQIGSARIEGIVRIASSTKMSGTMTFNYGFNDGDSCISTFDVSAVRQ
jgi:hypothetical protein